MKYKGPSPLAADHIKHACPKCGRKQAVVKREGPLWVIRCNSCAFTFRGTKKGLTRHTSKWPETHIAKRTGGKFLCGRNYIDVLEAKTHRGATCKTCRRIYFDR